MILYSLVRLILYPWLRFFLPLVSSKLRLRIRFEQRHKYDSKFLAEVCFHISSEGELEQSLALIEEYLRQKKVLVIFTSPSVEHKMKELKALHSNLSICALPILRFFPFSKSRNPSLWTSAQKFFMCRYDFFPELLCLARKADVSVLLNASVKSLRGKGYLKVIFYKFAYKSFNEIVLASKKELTYLEELNMHEFTLSPVFDFRTVQIQKRLEKADTRLKEKIKYHSEFFNFIKQWEYKDRLILGSYWDSELPELKTGIEQALKLNKVILCAAHDLSSQGLKSISSSFDKHNIPYIYFDNSISEGDLKTLVATKEPCIVIINIKGILCELYTYCSYAYVGGGFHKSIHSVLEPYIAGVNFITCGKNTSRSSEFDFVMSQAPVRIESYESFYSFFDCDSSLLSGELTKIEVKENFDIMYKKIESL